MTDPTAVLCVGLAWCGVWAAMQGWPAIVRAWRER
jgi:hypothetical protein